MWVQRRLNPGILQKKKKGLGLMHLYTKHVEM